MSDKIIAIDLGGTSVKLAIISTQGEILQKWSISTNILNGGKYIVPEIIESIKERLTLYQLSIHDFLGIGMGTPGVINYDDGSVIGAYNLNWTTKQAIRDQFLEHFELPFFIENDANLAALGEQWKGAGLHSANCVMLTLGTGVGGGVVINHQLVHGTNGAAGEIGHITIDPLTKIQCTCGKHGCLEAVASATGIINLARDYSQRFSGQSKIKEMIDNGDQVTSKDIFDAAKNNDIFSKKIVEQFTYYLALASSHIANILNPNYIIIGGGVSQAGEYLLKQIKEKYVEFTFPQIRDKTEVVLASLGNDAGILGAAQLVNINLNGVEV